MALLRGVNVGGKNRLPMEALRAEVAALGGEGARTFLQSGNVVFAASPEGARAVVDGLERALAARLGGPVPVVCFGAEELAAALADPPFADRDPGERHAFFLREAPGPVELDPDRSPGDAFLLRGRVLFAWLPGGMARTKLTNAWLDRRLGTTTTARNWRVATALVDLARACAREHP